MTRLIISWASQSPVTGGNNLEARWAGTLVHNRLFYLGNHEGQVRNEPVTVNDTSALATVGDATAQASFLANNPGLASTLAQSSGSFPRSFNQNTGFFKLSGILNSKNSLNLSSNFQRLRSPQGYFITPTSTGDDLSVTDASTSHSFQFLLMHSIPSVLTTPFEATSAKAVAAEFATF